MECTVTVGEGGNPGASAPLCPQAMLCWLRQLCTHYPMPKPEVQPNSREKWRTKVTAVRIRSLCHPILNTVRACKVHPKPCSVGSLCCSPTHHLCTWPAARPYSTLCTAPDSPHPGADPQHGAGQPLCATTACGASTTDYPQTSFSAKPAPNPALASPLL